MYVSCNTMKEFVFVVVERERERERMEEERGGNVLTFMTSPMAKMLGVAVAS